MRCCVCDSALGSRFYRGWRRDAVQVSRVACTIRCAEVSDATNGPVDTWRVITRSPSAFARASVLGALVAVGCGGGVQSHAQGLHDAMTAVTGVADPMYGAAVASCDAAEAIVVAAPGTSASSDRTAIDDIRSACDRVFAAFEALRQSQIVARSLADVALATGKEPDLVAAIHAVGAVQNAVDAAREAWEAALVVIKGSRGPR